MAQPDAGTNAAESTNANLLNRQLSAVIEAMSDGSTNVLTALASIASAVTASIIGGTTGTTANRALTSKGTTGRALQATPVTIAQSTGNVSGVGDLSASTISSPLASTTVVGVTEAATDAEVRAATTGNLSIPAAALESAAASVALTDASTIAVDWDTGINFTVTLAGNRTLGNPTNGQAGTWRTVLVTIDSTPGRTLAFGNQYVFPNGSAPTITSTAAANNRLTIFCRTSSIFELYNVGPGLA